MIEAKENINLVTLRRQSDLENSQREYQLKVDQQDKAETDTSPEVIVLDATSTSETVPTETESPTHPFASAINPLTALRLSLVAVVILGLLLITLRKHRKR